MIYAAMLENNTKELPTASADGKECYCDIIEL